MIRLQYRLLSKEHNYPVLYHYEHISEGEIAARFICDYFVKDGILYEKTSCANEPLSYVIYVQQIKEDIVPYTDNISSDRTNIRLELRHYIKDAESYPLLFTYELRDTLQVVLQLQSDFFMWQGREWRKTSSEIDEDRKVYVIYAELATEEPV